MGAAVSVLWWRAELAPLFAPAFAPASVAGQAAPSVGVIGVRGQPERETARRTIRAALQAALRTALAGRGDAATRVVLHAAPGEAPFAIADDGGAERRIALAISHDGELSVATFAFDGAVGIDVMHIVPVPDWEAVARDYLGPAVTRLLAGLPADERDAAFARAWSEREARLKCLGLPLDEWHAGGEAALQACRCLPLDLPAGYVGSLVLAPQPSSFY